MLRHAYANAQKRSWDDAGEGRDLLVGKRVNRQNGKKGVVVVSLLYKGGLRKGLGGCGERRRKRLAVGLLLCV